MALRHFFNKFLNNKTDNKDDIFEIDENFNAMMSNAMESTKGTSLDSIRRQTPVPDESVTQDVIRNLLISNELANIIVDAPIVDSLKNGIIITPLTENGETDVQLQKQLSELFEQYDILKKVIEVRKEARGYGYSILYPVIVEGKAKPLTGNKRNSLIDILDFNIIKRQDIVKIRSQKDKLQPDYGKVTQVEIINQKENSENEDTYDSESIKIDGSRFFFCKNNPVPENNMFINKNFIDIYQNDSMEYGRSIFKALMDQVVIMDSTEWSIFQLIFRANLLVYKTDKATLSKIDEDIGLRTNNKEMNAATFFAMGSDDDLKILNTASNIDPMAFIEAAATILSMHTNISKQRLMGNTQGALSGAQEDGKKYAEFLERDFNDNTIEIIYYIIDLFLEYLGKSKVSYKVTLPSLIVQDAKTKAETDKITSEATLGKLSVVEKALDMFDKAGYVPKKESISNLIKGIVSNDEIDGTEIAELLDSADEKLVSLTKQKQAADLEAIRINNLNNINNVSSNININDSKTKIADIVKKSQSGEIITVEEIINSL